LKITIILFWIFYINYQQMQDKSKERTYIMIKPDGVQRGLIGEIISRFEKKGYYLKALKLVHASEELLQKHYEDLKERPFFPHLVAYMHSGPVVCMIWEGAGVVAAGRKLLGETNPLNSLPGSIRGDFCIITGRNICHGSDKVESAEREIALWFTPEEIISWKSHSHEWIYE
jgi:nucleoside-diphosphate kinase